MSKEVKVGVLTVVAGVLLYFGFNFLKGKDFFSSKNKFYVIYENIDGLTVSNPVKIQGYAVGQVDQIDIMKENAYQLKVTISVDKSVEVGDKTEALLSSDLLGGKSIQLMLHPNTEVYSGGETLIADTEKSLTGLIEEKAVPVIQSVDEMLVNLNKSLSGADSATIHQSVQDVAKSTELLKTLMSDLNVSKVKYDKKLEQIADNLNILVVTLNGTLKGKVNPLLDKMDAVADTINNIQFNEMLASMESALKDVEEVMKKINSTDGTVGMLMNDKALYQNLNKTLVDMDTLVRHMRQHPKHFFAPLGKNNKQIRKDLKKEPIK